MSVGLVVREKLVRDRIPEIIRASGREVDVRVAGDDEIDMLLRTKIVEEAGELLSSGDVEEIADLLEAIMSLLKYRGIDPSEVENLRTQKRQERGGFEERFVIRLDGPQGLFRSDGTEGT